MSSRLSPPCRQVNASTEEQSAQISSMERALRSMNSPITMTPRRIDGNGPLFKYSIVSSDVDRLSNDSSNNNNNEEAVRVAVRVRPLAPGGDQCAGRAWRVASDQNAIIEIPDAAAAGNNHAVTPGRAHRISGDNDFVYDKVFGENANTCEIYDALVRDLVESVTEEGINGTIFTYGQTCSGKTFTMQGSGDNDSCVGIIQLAAKDVFQSIKEDESNSECSVRVSYVEIYNEELRDLLNDSNRRSSSGSSLIIREDKKGAISVDGLKEVAVKSLDQLMEVFKVGEKNKSVGSTKMNDRSSRSHAILKIILEKKIVFNDEENSPSIDNLVVKTTSVLNLVDLAGSESIRHTGASGMQKKEGGMINQSLLTLSKVLMSLGQKNPGHVNYRDSKLTRILKPSLSGNARMAVICCVSPSSKYVEETRSTLQFATRAKLVKTNAVRHEEVEDADLIATLRLENARAKWTNKKLEDELRQMEKLTQSALITRRELANLQKFVFSQRVTQPNGDQRLSLAMLDDNAGKGVTFYQPYPTSKDDSCIPSSAIKKNELYASSNRSHFLHNALDFKATQVKNLQARIDCVNDGEGTKARRHSLVTGARSLDDVYRRIDSIDETQSTRLDARSAEIVDMVQMESKLASANRLIDSLERQIDDLSGQKNDALDWIEELFAKSDQKDESIRRITEEKNDLIKKCDELDSELSTIKGLLHRSDEKIRLNSDESDNKMILMEAKLESTHDTLTQVNMENMKLQADIKVHEHFSRLKSMDEVLTYRSPQTELSGDNVSDMEKSNAELLGRLKELQDYTDAYAEEKQSLIEQIEKYEEELSMAETKLKSKADELDDAMFSLNKEREKWLTERSVLVESAGRSLPTSANDEDVKSLIDVNQKLRDKIISLTNELNDATQQLHVAREGREDVVGGSKENEEQVSRLTLLHENHECKQKISDLSKELEDLHRQVGNTNNELAELHTENTRLKDEVRDLTNDFDECLERVNDLTDQLIHMQNLSERLVKSEAENSELTERLEAANSKIGDLLDQLTDASQQRNSSSHIEATVGEASSDNLFEGNRRKFLEVRAMTTSKEEAARTSFEFDKLKAENTRLTAELRSLTNDTTIHDLSNELLATKQKLQAGGGMLTKFQAENAELVACLDAANANIKDLHGQLLTTKKELKIQGKAQVQIRSSFDRLQSHVETLTAENSELQSARDSLQVRARELQELLSTATADRDKLMESNTKLLAKFSVLSYERDEAVDEKDQVKRKLDRIAADFEADYETVRSKIDTLIDEKMHLEDKVAFLEASKTSVQANADRILQRDNILAKQHDRLKAVYKDQSILLSHFEKEADQLRTRLEQVKFDNERLRRDTRALKDMNKRQHHDGKLFDETNRKKKLGSQSKNNFIPNKLPQGLFK